MNTGSRETDWSQKQQQMRIIKHKTSRPKINAHAHFEATVQLRPPLFHFMLDMVRLLTLRLRFRTRRGGALVFLNAGGMGSGSGRRCLNIQSRPARCLLGAALMGVSGARAWVRIHCTPQQRIYCVDVLCSCIACITQTLF